MINCDNRGDPTRNDYIPEEAKASGDAEWLRLGERVRVNAGKDKGSRWGESETRDGRADVDLPFAAAIASG